MPLSRRAKTQRFLRAPDPWGSEDEALAFIDPRFPDDLGIELVRDLLRVAKGQTVTSNRHLSDRQMSMLREHRVTTLVPQQWQVPDTWRLESQKLAMWSMALEAEAREAISVLRDANLSPTVLKGMATRYLDYPDPSLRHSGDLDLLVSESELGLAVEVLKAEGYSRHNPERVDQDLIKGITLTSQAGVEIDIHTRLRSEVRESGDGLRATEDFIPELLSPALTVEGRLVHAAEHCFHTPPGHRRLSGLADVTNILDRDDLDLSLVRALARDLGLEAPVSATLLVEAKIMDRVSAAAQFWDRPKGWEAFAYGRSDRIRWAEKVDAVLRIEGTTAKLRFVKQMAVPSLEFIAWKGGLRRYFFANEVERPTRDNSNT